MKFILSLLGFGGGLLILIESSIGIYNWEALCLPKAIGGLGVRDLKSFNSALLAKQGWGLIRNTRTLLYDILKARYFKHGTYLEANIGFHPSFSWRSI